MVTTKEILERLKNGEDAEAIANELVNTLNTALEQHKAEEEEAKRQEEAQKALAEKHAAKVKDMQEILDLIHDFCIDYYCDTNEDIDVVTKAFDEYDAETVIKMVEDMGAYVADLNKVQKELNHAFGSLLGDVPVVKVKKVESNPDAVINSFLKSMGL
jgi:GTP:adenosylcobinamide-phosphate guanylyltransferase